MSKQADRQYRFSINRKQISSKVLTAKMVKHTHIWVCDLQGHKDGYTYSVACLFCNDLHRSSAMDCFGRDHWLRGPNDCGPHRLDKTVTITIAELREALYHHG